jgi:hypothetical protein
VLVELRVTTSCSCRLRSPGRRRLRVVRLGISRWETAQDCALPAPVKGSASARWREAQQVAQLLRRGTPVAISALQARRSDRIGVVSARSADSTATPAGTRDRLSGAATGASRDRRGWTTVTSLSPAVGVSRTRDRGWSPCDRRFAASSHRYGRRAPGALNLEGLTAAGGAYCAGSANQWMMSPPRQVIFASLVVPDVTCDHARRCCIRQPSRVTRYRAPTIRQFWGADTWRWPLRFPVACLGIIMSQRSS